jgi:hypothetical protein
VDARDGHGDNGGREVLSMTEADWLAANANVWDMLRFVRSTVVSLAQPIYDELAFDRLPILADALEDAGSTNADILNHCRQPGEHVRGCWALDLILGRK